MIKRRHFIVSGVGAGGLALILYNTNPAWQAAQDAAPDAVETPPLLIESGLGGAMDALLGSLENADALGRAWLDEQSPEPTLSELGEIITGKIDPGAAQLSDLTAQQIRDDFSQNDLCTIDGWQLSVTECQLAALRVLAIDSNPANLPILEARAKARRNAELAIGEIAPLKNWGPQETRQGEKFNEQADGHSGLWFQFQGAPARARIMIDGEYARTNVRSDVVTSGLYGELQDRVLSTPGEYEIALVDPIRKIKQPIGALVVREDPDYQARQGQAQENGFCPITRWGPRKTEVGVAANEQPDGSMGVWVHTECLPEDVELRFGDDPLRITRRDFGLTSTIPLALIETPGETPLQLINTTTEETVVIGHITIQ